MTKRRGQVRRGEERRSETERRGDERQIKGYAKSTRVWERRKGKERNGEDSIGKQNGEEARKDNER